MSVRGAASTRDEDVAPVLVGAEPVLAGGAPPEWRVKSSACGSYGAMSGPNASSTIDSATMARPSREAAVRAREAVNAPELARA